MRNTKTPFLAAILLICACSAPSFGQQRVFNWLPANDESVRLDPANYHTARTYHPGANGGNIHVEIQAEKPITLFLTPAEDWNQALQHPENIANLQQLCPKEHVLQITYLCDLPAAAMTLVIRDDRNSLDPAVFAGLGAVLDPNRKADRAVSAGIVAVLTGQGPATRRFNSPNDVHIQYFRWDCVENCVQPEYQWFRQVKEKYELTSFLKVYGGFTPDHDGTQVSIKIKAPVPMVVAMLPSEVAMQLHAKPEMFELALEKNACQQRGVQSSQFECTFNAADGPQSLIVAPEATGNEPKHKKAEIEMQFVRCITNCELLESKR